MGDSSLYSWGHPSAVMTYPEGGVEYAGIAEETIKPAGHPLAQLPALYRGC